MTIWKCKIKVFCPTCNGSVPCDVLVTVRELHISQHRRIDHQYINEKHLLNHFDVVEQ